MTPPITKCEGAHTCPLAPCPLVAPPAPALVAGEIRVSCRRGQRLTLGIVAGVG